MDRVELKSDGIRVSIKLPIASAEKSRAQLPDQVAIARSFPMQLKRRGVELRLIVGDHNRSAAIVDLSLLKAVARAHRWFDEISTGKARSLAAIAAREGLAVRYVGRLIRLAFHSSSRTIRHWGGFQAENLAEGDCLVYKARLVRSPKGKPGSKHLCRPSANDGSVRFRGRATLTHSSRAP